MSKVSIIVPIFQVEKYLGECIESLINQSYKNLEIILVDDGAQDNCPFICNKWSKKDSRIKVIHKKNGGLSDARNAGLDIATGDYIIFVDSDDYVNKRFIEKLLRTAVKNNVMIVQCGYLQVTDSGEILKKVTHGNSYFLNSKKMITELKTDNCIENTVVWNKIYKRELFKEIRFPYGKINEDEYTTYKLLDLAKNIYIINEPLYYYRYNHNSIMGKKFNLKRLDIIDGLKERIDYFKDKDMDLYYASIELFILNIMNIYKEVEENFKDRDDILNDLKADFNNYLKLINLKRLSTKNKIKIILFKIKPELYFYLKKIKE